MQPRPSRSFILSITATFVLMALLTSCSLLSGQELLIDSLPTASGDTAIDPDSPDPTVPPASSQTPDPPLPTGVSAALPVPTQPAASPSPSPTPAPALVQLTSGGCCPEPFWSPDGTQVLFLDKPSPDLPTGFWGISPVGGEPALFTDRLGIYSPDMSLLAYPESEQTVVERRSDGQRWTIPNGGRSISFSPDSALVAWTAGDPGPPFDTPLREVWVSAFDGTQPRQVTQVTGGGFSGWLSDGRILLSGRMDPADPEPGLWAVSLQDGSYARLASGERLRGVSISPGGSWLAYQRVFDPDPAQNGIWLVNTRIGESRKLELFGGYRWQDDQHLLVIPLDTSQPHHRIWQVDAAAGDAVGLTDPAVSPFKVANGDWNVSPDGKMIVFVSAADHNLWLIDLEP